jgi:hypothetical protein
MKKSARKEFQDLLNRDTRPRSPKTTDDQSDDLARQFDDGTTLRADIPSTTGTASTPGTTGSLPVAPARDYHKVANSISRTAVPAGLFKGKSKQTYDYLYLRTRGAIVPTRTVQASWREIMKGARIGSDKTLREHLKQLRNVGLVMWEWEDGSQAGSVYTVYLPEEATGISSTPGTGGTPGTSRQILPPVPAVESTTGTSSLSADFQSTSDDSKTSFKTNTNDDDDASALLSLNSIFTEATRKLTGRAPKAHEREQWGELARVIVEELNEAAARAESISSVPAFLAAHLRRKLAPKPVTRKREGNQRPLVPDPSSPSSSPDPNRRLAAEEIDEQARIIAEVIEGGYTIEQAEAQFAGSFHPEDWATIRSTALAQVERRR